MLKPWNAISPQFITFRLNLKIVPCFLKCSDLTWPILRSAEDRQVPIFLLWEDCDLWSHGFNLFVEALSVSLWHIPRFAMPGLRLQIATWLVLALFTNVKPRTQPWLAFTLHWINEPYGKSYLREAIGFCVRTSRYSLQPVINLCRLLGIGNKIIIKGCGFRVRVEIRTWILLRTGFFKVLILNLRGCP